MIDGREDFQYTILRVVPLVQRGECLNVGVVVFCPRLAFLALRFELDPARLHVLDPGLDAERVRPHLEAIAAVLAGEDRAGALSALPASDRFGWAAAPSSTMIQPSEVHTGITSDPATTLERLFAELVAPPRAGGAP